MKHLRILSGDPASEKGGDSFGTVGLEATYPEKIIYIRLAKIHKKQPYHIIASYYEKVKLQINPHFILLEKNFDYDNLLPAFTHLNPTYITTTSNLTIQNRINLKAVDKPWVIKEIIKLHQNKQIQYPPKISADMKELINQRNEMSAFTSLSGHISYKRVRGRHDDLYSAKILGINHILRWWETCDDND